MEGDSRWGEPCPASPRGWRTLLHQSRWKRPCGVDHVWVINVDGRSPKRITKKGGALPSWSPDGKKIVYTRMTEFISLGGWVPEYGIPPGAEGIGDLYVINPDGSGDTRLTHFYPR
jgi:Tol biopolymer transport system component